MTLVNNLFEHSIAYAFVALVTHHLLSKYLRTLLLICELLYSSGTRISFMIQ